MLRPSSDPKLRRIYDAIETCKLGKFALAENAEKVSARQMACIKDNTPFSSDWAVLDFGCGIGRMSAQILASLGPKGRLVGIDIVDGVVEFCQKNIAPHFPNSEFLCTTSSNAAYDHHKGSASTTLNLIDEKEFFDGAVGNFDLACAFSVFTHLGPEASEQYFLRLRECLRRSGYLVFTAFLIDSISVPQVAAGKTPFSFPKNPSIDDDFFDGFPKNPLGFVAYSQKLLFSLLSKSSFYVERILFGAWRGFPGASGQDCIIARPIPGPSLA